MLGRDHRPIGRQIAEPGAVEMDEIDLLALGQSEQPLAERRELALAVRQPVEADVEDRDPQPADRFRLGALRRAGWRSGDRQDHLDAAIAQAAGQLETVLPHPADAVGDQQNAPRRSCGLGHAHRQARSSSPSGRGRSSWMSLNSSKERR